jgi:hypothetical protein
MAHFVGQRLEQPLQNNLRFPQLPQEEGALIRAEQPALPVRFPAQIPNAVNNALLWQMFTLVDRMAEDRGSSNMTTRLLTSENKELKQQIIQRADALEEEWLAAAEHVSAKVDTIYFKFNRLHQEITAEEQEGRRILALELKCVIGKEWDYAALQHAFGEDYSTRGAAGAADHICYSYLQYSSAYRDDWEMLHLTIRGSLKALVKAEVRKIKDEKLPVELILEEVGDLQQIDAADVNEAGPIDLYAVFHAFTQKSQEQIQTQDGRNDAIREKNQGLKNKKMELENVSKRFLGLFHTSLRYPLKFLRDHIKGKIQMVKNQVKDYPKLLAELGSSPTYRCSGCYKKGIELHGKICSVLGEVIVLTEALEKEITP